MVGEEHRPRMDSGWRQRPQEELRSGLLREMGGSVVGFVEVDAAAGPGYRAERHFGHRRLLAWDFVVEGCS